MHNFPGSPSAHAGSPGGIGPDSNAGDPASSCGAPLLPLPLGEKKESKEAGIKEEGGGGGAGAEEGGVVKANKGMILRKSVEYIRWVVLFGFFWRASLLAFFF